MNIFSISPVLRDIENNLLNRKLWPDMTVLPNSQDAAAHRSERHQGVHAPLRLRVIRVSAYKVNHSVPAVGYLVEDRKGRRFFLYRRYRTNGNDMGEGRGKKGSIALIIESSFPNRLEETGHHDGSLDSGVIKKRTSKNEGDALNGSVITHLKASILRDDQQRAPET